MCIPLQLNQCSYGSEPSDLLTASDVSYEIAALLPMVNSYMENFS
jgi:hypothetical protein